MRVSEKVTLFFIFFFCNFLLTLNLLQALRYGCRKVLMSKDILIKAENLTVEYPSFRLGSITFEIAYKINKKIQGGR